MKIEDKQAQLERRCDSLIETIGDRYKFCDIIGKSYAMREVYKVNIRIISASNRDLVERMKKGKMREDFFFRIGVITIGLPPLRDRRVDIPLLIDHFVEHYGFKSNLPSHVRDALCAYEWPGNVRELQNEIQRYITQGYLEFISGAPDDPMQNGSMVIQKYLYFQDFPDFPIYIKSNKINLLLFYSFRKTKENDQIG